jgi:hypothetical protein
MVRLGRFHDRGGRRYHDSTTVNRATPSRFGHPMSRQANHSIVRVASPRRKSSCATYAKPMAQMSPLRPYRLHVLTDDDDDGVAFCGTLGAVALLLCLLDLRPDTSNPNTSNRSARRGSPSSVGSRRMPDQVGYRTGGPSSLAPSATVALRSDVGLATGSPAPVRDTSCSVRIGITCWYWLVVHSM